VTKLATTTVWFEVEDRFFTGKAFNGLNGFQMIGGVQWTASGDKRIGRATIGAMNGGIDITGAQDILELVFSAKDALGETEVTLTKIDLSGYNEAGEAVYIETGFDGASVKTEIVPVILPCDVNRDGKVNQLDLTTAQLYYQATEGDANWNDAVNADANESGTVDIEDFILILNSIAW
jgi:hypothetical protein